MKKGILAALAWLLLAAGCAAPPPAAMEDTPTEENPASQEEPATEKDPAPGEEPVSPEALFASLPDTLLLASGAGGWSTELTVAEDGTFSGVYHDSDMGVTGEDFPNGTVYTCAFSGKLGSPRQVSEHTYSVAVEAQEREEAPAVSYADGVRYIAAESYGLEGAETLLLCLPGAAEAELPEDFHAGWAEEYRDPAALDFTVLYNEGAGLAFVEFPVREGT